MRKCKHGPSIIGLATLLAITATSSQANGIFRIAIEGGGDEIASGVFASGEQEDLKAGGLVQFELGAQIGLITENPTEFSLGYKFDSIDASNGDIRFNRVTFNAMQYMRTGEHIRVGAGITYHLNPTLEFDAFGIDDSFESDNALGFMLGVDYSNSTEANIGFRATFIDYEGGDFLEKASGNSVGLYVTWYP